jgi:hypothetical protein
MEVREGFIVGIFNYCDRWCERCPLTSRCLVFADVAALEFEHAHGPLTEPHAARERRKLEAERGRVGATVESFAHTGREVEDAPSGHLPVDLELMIGPDPEVITRGPELRAHLSALARSDDETVRLAIETIEHFAIFVPMKMFRALSQLAEGPGDLQSDANGSGKAALLGLERMETAWRTLTDAHHVTPRDAAPFLAEIARLQRNLQRALPNARAFIRPGFDEPDHVQRLEALDS